MGPNTHKINKEFLQIKPLCPSLRILGSSSVVMKAKTKILSPSPQRNFELASNTFLRIKMKTQFGHIRTELNTFTFIPLPTSSDVQL
jgi:hypothetical protein